MKELYRKHKVLLKITTLLVVLVILWGAVELISLYQLSHRGLGDNTTADDFIISTTVEEDADSDFTAFDVTGLTNEQIDEYLQNYREQKEGAKDGSN